LQDADRLSADGRRPIPGSSKGPRARLAPDLRVPMREAPSRARRRSSRRDNAPFAIYDTSGAYHRRQREIDSARAWRQCARTWIAEARRY